MPDLQDVLAAGTRRLPRAAPPHASRRALVLGGGGALGGAVLEQLLGSHHFQSVGVLAQATLQPALRGLVVVADSDAALVAFAPDTALIVFDRERHANGRDAAFVRPQPAALPAQAHRLWQAGVRRLVVVVPHRPALLPHALKAGLASLDEAAVAALGFEHLVFLRMAQYASSAAHDGAPPPNHPQRLAGWLLGQLQWLVPQREQPVRSLTVARVAAALALALPDAADGTRVLPPEVLWLAAQGAAVDDVVRAWLAGDALPSSPVRRRW